MVTLKQIKPKRISDQVFDQLKELIFKGQLKPGEQLMNERDLAQSMGVSRPTVREAINKLVAIGLLDHHQGHGTFVKSPADDADKNPLAAIINGHDFSLQDLLEVRLGLECNAVALAAQRATDEDIRELERCLGEMVAEIKNKEKGLGSDADLSFHMAIAYATKNPVQIQIMRSFYDLLFFGIKANLEHLYADPANLERVIDQHTAIVNTVHKRDSEGAYKAMQDHITFVMDFFRDREITQPPSSA